MQGDGGARPAAPRLRQQHPGARRGVGAHAPGEAVQGESGLPLLSPICERRALRQRIPCLLEK